MQTEYEFYSSKKAKSTTLLEAAAENKEDSLEKDAELICRFVAPSHEDAIKYANMLIDRYV